MQSWYDSVINFLCVRLSILQVAELLAVCTLVYFKLQKTRFLILDAYVWKLIMKQRIRWNSILTSEAENKICSPMNKMTQCLFILMDNTVCIALVDTKHSLTEAVQNLPI